MPKDTHGHVGKHGLIAFEATVVQAASDGRLLVELKNGHRFAVRADRDAALKRLHRGARGRLELAPHPTGSWRFIAPD